MNTEGTAIVEKKGEERREETCTDCVFVELGQVTQETKGAWVGYSSDAGFYKIWP